MAFILTEPTRKDKLKGWLLAHRLTYAFLGDKIGMSAGNICTLLSQETARPERVAQLAALGIPEELLPRPLYTPPGPKPKKRRNA